MRRSFLLAAGLVAMTSTSSTAGSAWAAAQPPGGEARTTEQRLLDRYCLTCHNTRLRTADLALDTVDVSDVGAHPEIWEKVVRKLRAGAMPPAARPRPDSDTYAAFTTWLETELDRVAAARPNPGRTDTFHRLNRSEYHNVIRDLLALEVDVAALLPADDGSYGFDNIAGVLGMSPTLLERYLSAARKISRLAVGRPAPSATAETFRLATDLTQDLRVDGLPFGTRGGTRFTYTFPEDAEYAFQVRLGRDASGTLKIFNTPHQLEVSLDGHPLQTFVVGEARPEDVERSSPEYRQYLARQRTIDEGWEVRGTGPGRSAHRAGDLPPEDLRVCRDVAAAVPASIHEHYRRRHPVSTVCRERDNRRSVRGEWIRTGGWDAKPRAHLRVPSAARRSRRRVAVRAADLVHLGATRLSPSGGGARSRRVARLLRRRVRGRRVRGWYRTRAQASAGKPGVPVPGRARPRKISSRGPRIASAISNWRPGSRFSSGAAFRTTR